MLLAIAATWGWDAAPALARWRQTATTRASVAYNQGIAFDQTRDDYFFDGVSSPTNSGLYRTTATLKQTAANLAVIPATTEGYNHAGDLGFDPRRRRILLPLECYYPGAGGNTCGTGAIGVADPVTLRFLYYVNLDTAQIRKAMWAEASPDGRWIWTSSGTHLLVYCAAAVNRQTADRQRAGRLGGIIGTDAGAVLPAGGVTGATFYQSMRTRGPGLLLALNRGSYSEVISYAINTRGRVPRITGRARTEVTEPISASNHESEGLAVTGLGTNSNPLGAVLHWQFLPAISPFRFYSRILTFSPASPPPRLGGSKESGHSFTG
jgi:hypothetical protein